ncbi:MAG TPA: hypothetical protein PKA53_03060 [Sphingobacterium sp.]|nr:hypothetical protein [Sphingobacterium sp.]
MKNKEYGSDFHYINSSDFRVSDGASPSTIFDGTEQLYFSGRAALRAIISNGIDKNYWEKIYVPTYYCQEVFDFVRDLNIEIEFYRCNPLQNVLPPSIKDDDKSALLVVNYFGISALDFGHLKNISVIEDLTHDLSLINQSKADYVFGSLRKILPLPVGGFVKSKQRLDKIPPTLFSEEVAHEKFSGMLLKKKYLEGKIKEKDTFRNLFIQAEHSLGNLETYASLPLIVNVYFSGLDIFKIITSKKNNSLLAKSKIKSNSIFELLTCNSNAEYTLILMFNKKEDRDNLKKHLIEHNIYPVVLWPNQIHQEDITIENSLLFIHIDFRYSAEDIQFIADIINQYSSHAI